jgi:hypothetical protein
MEFIMLVASDARASKLKRIRARLAPWSANRHAGKGFRPPRAQFRLGAAAGRTLVRTDRSYK